MRPLEDELRSLLKREEPAEGFAGRVLERVRQPEASGRSTRWFPAFSHRWLPLWTVAGAIVCGVLAGSYAGHRAREIRRGEMAKAQAIEGLSIASNELNAVFQKALVKSASR